MNIFPLGDSALTVELAKTISTEINDRVINLARKIEDSQFVGLIEVVSAYSSLTIFYNPVQVRKNNSSQPTAFAAIKEFVEKLILELGEIQTENQRSLKIPVCFDREFAFDLEFIAAEKNLSERSVIEIFTNGIYRVFMLGFLPGFAYMGELNEKIACPRKSEPRLRIPAGSVGIADRQTGIYSLDSPGGWQIIGRTPLRLFSPKSQKPTYFEPGDAVQFYEIDKLTFENLNQKQSETHNSDCEIE